MTKCAIGWEPLRFVVGGFAGAVVEQPDASHDTP